ncbi:tumor necrosis factor alpha-induced protein 8-like protein [Patella vulgata]|uniref:tumor necrosis factor alpha-induced protein 8-like protein n=1 Tax=Patella vulgata TaxID=6465 RepID=UPI0021806A6A|nr:tumor necrosis factor alpha-induced protein 8-like protein [Patella vulgata]XP_050401259.1 tumor necrosis factor alpha-induced protein 8-like protein [Patella vulgata]XP_055956254.1 tumor necrosis factor alpha-induced protein 8-like protein [Patella vulgata]XP_055956255.1 tumor necrosis factor alpha-induced protein 8-like protein [Patella vulgata]
MTEPGAGFDSRGLGLRAQKKLLGKMSGKKMAKVFIDDTTGRVLDNTHRIIKEFTGTKKESEKTLKYLIKTVVKIGILYKNDQFNGEELKMVENFKQKFHSLAMTVVSFHEVDFTYDRSYLRKSLEECKAILQSLVARHLTEKSKNRIDIVFDFFQNPELLDSVFQTDSQYKDIMDLIVKDLNKMMDEGNL